MWPRLLAQLMEILPHLTRLIPLADRFFATRAASDKAMQEALASLSTSVHGSVGGVTASQEEIARQLQEQNSQIAKATAETARARIAIETYSDRTVALESQIRALAVWVKIVAMLLLVVLAVMVALLLRLH